MYNTSILLISQQIELKCDSPSLRHEAKSSRPNDTAEAPPTFFLLLSKFHHVALVLSCDAPSYFMHTIFNSSVPHHLRVFGSLSRPTRDPPFGKKTFFWSNLAGKHRFHLQRTPELRTTLMSIFNTRNSNNLCKNNENFLRSTGNAHSTECKTRSSG